MPKLSVIRLENSAAMSSCRVDGSSPFLKLAMVGNEVRRRHKDRRRSAWRERSGRRRHAVGTCLRHCEEDEAGDQDTAAGRHVGPHGLCVVEPIGSTSTETPMEPAFWKVSVSGTLSPTLSGCLRSRSMT